MGNPKKSSKFLCLSCMQINQLGAGIQRGGHTREKYHIKDLTCFNKPCCGKQTKNIEIRWCDDYLEVYDKALKSREQYYSNKTENNIDRKVG